MRTTGQFRPKLHFLLGAVLSALGIVSLAAYAAGVPTLELEPIEVTAPTPGLIGVADTASVGTVTREQLQARPTFRPGELLEETPGLIVTQHSGEGKANQYFLRGFNLDHGTDLRVDFNGTPVNQRSHGHGQGYADLNFLIPELVSTLQYKKGPYYADEGDFASAGAISLDYVNVLPKGIASLTLGEDGYRRALVADTPKLGAGHLLYGLELFRYDGPWDHPEDFKKYNGVLRYSKGDEQDGFDITALAYSSHGDATNQIAQRAVDEGRIGRFGTLDPTDGSDSERFSLSAGWRRSGKSSLSKANIYVIRNQLNLFSNFTYFLDFPEPPFGTGQGDQFEQEDRRTTGGFNASNTWFTDWGSKYVENTVGVQVQNDNIINGLFRTDDRARFQTVRQDHIVESSVGIYLENRTQWLPKFRTVTGVRADVFRFDVNSNDPANSGTVNDHIVNPKLELIFGPWADTEYYISAGGGFHSNDARGTTINVDPSEDVGSNVPAQKVPGLVRSKGYEVGLRTGIVPNLQSTLAVYLLDFDSELVFVGDAGNTEAGRPSRRVGFEFSNYYTPTDWLTIDGDLAYANARFRNDDPVVGDHIPGAVEGVATIGASVDNLGPWFGGVQLRYFGPRPLIEDDSVRSDATTLLAGRVGYKIKESKRGLGRLQFAGRGRRRHFILLYFAAAGRPCGRGGRRPLPSGGTPYISAYRYLQLLAAARAIGGVQ